MMPDLPGDGNLDNPDTADPDFRESDKRSAEGEAYPDLVPIGTPAAQVPVRERLLTVTEKESELGWRSDVT
ncbi:MAG: hypothetical protein RL628_1440, partial [Actinomycetota bacterium]